MANSSRLAKAPSVQGIGRVTPRSPSFRSTPWSTTDRPAFRTTSGISGIPVDPVRIARTLGLDVVTANLPADVSGALVKDPGRDPSILDADAAANGAVPGDDDVSTGDHRVIPTHECFPALDGLMVLADLF